MKNKLVQLATATSIVFAAASGQAQWFGQKKKPVDAAQKEETVDPAIKALIDLKLIAPNAVDTYKADSTADSTETIAKKLLDSGVIDEPTLSSAIAHLQEQIKNYNEAFSYALSHSNEICDYKSEKDGTCVSKTSHPQNFNLEVGGIFRTLSNTLEIPSAVTMCLAFQESQLNPNARNSSSGALGIFQLMPYSESTWGEITNLVNDNVLKPENEQSPIYKNWLRAWDNYILSQKNRKNKSADEESQTYHLSEVEASAIKVQGPKIDLVYTKNGNKVILKPELARSATFNIITGMTYFKILEEKLLQTLKSIRPPAKISIRDYYSALVGAHNMGPTKFNRIFAGLFDKKTGQLKNDWSRYIVNSNKKNKFETQNHIKLINECIDKGVYSRYGKSPKTIVEVWDTNTVLEKIESGKPKEEPKKPWWSLERKTKSNPEKETVQPSDQLRGQAR